jgi:serine/threonine-protein kinase HipA
MIATTAASVMTETTTRSGAAQEERAFSRNTIDEMMARYASYETLAEEINRRFTDPRTTLRELFGRIAFNILSGNTDDHARNHAAFWDGRMLTLTPAYDICPQQRTGQEASQAMLISGTDRASRISSCIAAAPIFGLSGNEGARIIELRLETIRSRWKETCDEAGLTEVDRRLFRGRQFLNPYAFDDLTGSLASPRDLALDIRESMHVSLPTAAGPR